MALQSRRTTVSYVAAWCVCVCVWVSGRVCACPPVVSVCVCRWLLEALVELRDQKTVVYMHSVTQVLAVVLFV